ncbi:hypothetical protein E5676_scaffold675G00060 [Cucumis melo var. makuwa]|uniref:Uncharacterized protein n=1 Tax=Cucumis melo var. makuwa TaxID=1194695 RepID=A0A5D3BX80_CUCMM|nr:hypothetical protein E5676_scaffold675G00060 [Cucumis melo var. makuwa]
MRFGEREGDQPSSRPDFSQLVREPSRSPESSLLVRLVPPHRVGKFEVALASRRLRGSSPSLFRRLPVGAVPSKTRKPPRPLRRSVVASLFGTRAAPPAAAVPHFRPEQETRAFDSEPDPRSRAAPTCEPHARSFCTEPSRASLLPQAQAEPVPASTAEPPSLGLKHCNLDLGTSLLGKHTCLAVRTRQVNLQGRQRSRSWPAGGATCCAGVDPNTPVTQADLVAMEQRYQDMLQAALAPFLAAQQNQAAPI